MHKSNYVAGGKDYKILQAVLYLKGLKVSAFATAEILGISRGRVQYIWRITNSFKTPNSKCDKAGKKLIKSKMKAKFKAVPCDNTSYPARDGKEIDDECLFSVFDI